MADDVKKIDDAITEAVSGPLSHEVDGEKVTNHPLPDMIAASKHLSSRRAARNPFKAIRFFKISPPGTN